MKKITWEGENEKKKKTTLVHPGLGDLGGHTPGDPASYDLRAGYQGAGGAKEDCRDMNPLLHLQHLVPSGADHS